MIFNVLTLFPEMVISGLDHSMLKRAREAGLIEINCINIRDFAHNKHNQVDDAPYGGGAGMVMQAQPVYEACQSIMQKGDRVIYVTPQGKTFCQGMARELAKEKRHIILCGHYEGIDQRVLDEIVTDEISLGDFVLTGGELAAMAIIDATARLVPGVLGKEESFQEESFSGSLLEYPHYTRPDTWMDRNVPEVLLSGHHENIRKWRREQSLLRTLEKRPELIQKAQLTDKEYNWINSRNI